MGSRLGRRVVLFANLPIKLLMPSAFDNIQEIALKTIPSASKIEMKRVLESLYGFEVDKVRTLNMEGKKKKRGGFLIAKPDYKKAYVTLRNPLSISLDLFPLKIVEEDKERVNKQRRSSIVDDGEGKRHWLDGKKEEKVANEKGSWRGRSTVRDSMGEKVKFPWSSMRSSRLLSGHFKLTTSKSIIAATLPSFFGLCFVVHLEFDFMKMRIGKNEVWNEKMK